MVLRRFLFFWTNVQKRTKKEQTLITKWILWWNFYGSKKEHSLNTYSLMNNFNDSFRIVVVLSHSSVCDNFTSFRNRNFNKQTKQQQIRHLLIQIFLPIFIQSLNWEVWAKKKRVGNSHTFQFNILSNIFFQMLEISQTLFGIDSIELERLYLWVEILSLECEFSFSFQSNI